MAVYDITTRWYIGNLIFRVRQIILQEIVQKDFYCLFAASWNGY